MKLKKRYLAEVIPVIAGLIAIAAPCGGAIAQQQPAEATVNMQGEGEKTESLPMTVNVISRKTLEAADPQDGYEALKNVGGVTNSNSKGTISDNINIRGIPLSFSTSYRINGGLPIANVLAIPMDNKERIDVLKGANALMFGVASPAGIVNLVTKRAKDQDVSTATFTGSSFGQFGASIDLGRKFGDEKQLGLRVNLAKTHLETGVDGGKGHSQFGGVAADWKATDRLSFRLDYEQFSREVVEQSTLFQLKPVNGVISVPSLPDPTKLLSGPWAMYHPAAENYLLRADFIVSNAWTATAEAGHAESVRDRFISRISNYSLLTGQGTENITLVKDQKYINTYAKVELRGKLETGPLKHSLTFGVMSNERYANVPSTTALTIAQNIYNPVALPAPGPAAPLTYLPQDSKDTGLYAYDTIGFGREWLFLVGLRTTTYKADNTLAGNKHSLTDTNKTSPGVGAVYNLTPLTSIYASYMKGLEETGVAPVGTVNQFTILPPADAKQSEIGVRTTPFKGVSASAAYFDITRGNPVTNVASNTFLIDGTTNFKGLEGNVSAEINPQLTVNAAGQVMQAVQNSNLDKTITGLRPENTPKLSGNLSLSYRPDYLRGVNLTAAAFFTGQRAVNPQNQAFIPGVTLFSVGAGYLTSIAGHRTSFQLNIDNLGNKAYWSSAGGGAFGIGMVRSVKMIAKIDI
ncbi:MAG: TonB-dependent siderophore receptor [Proteobacteria bacterium]|nr:TonB-dependent siderophore receptor [Pseudomonadota bacterium]